MLFLPALVIDNDVFGAVWTGVLDAAKNAVKDPTTGSLLASTGDDFGGFVCRTGW